MKLLIIHFCLLEFVKSQLMYNVPLPIRCHYLSEKEEDLLISKIAIRMYYGMGSKEYDEKPLDQIVQLLKSPNYNASRCIAVYFMGFHATPDTDHVRAITQSYVRCSGANVWLFDWSAVGARPYAEAVGAVAGVARAAAAAILASARAGARICHFAGHGAGAHLQSVLLRHMYPARLRSLVGLDPAFPLFYNTSGQCAGHMWATDAECVSVVHTDAGGHGTPYIVGDTDFFPNGGASSQPGCHAEDFGSEGPLCSHNAAAWLWAEALCRQNALVARRCGSWAEFTAGICDNGPTVLLGDCGKKRRGLYFLKTNDAHPFGLGEKGAIG